MRHPTFADMKMRLLFLLSLGCCGCATAQTGLLIPFKDTPPLVDGQLQEWPTTPTAEFSVMAQHPPLRNHVAVWLGFDDSHLYGAFSVQDTRLVQTEQGQGNPRLYLNDAVEIYLDTKNDSHEFMDGNDYQLIMDMMGEVVVFRGGDKYQLKVDRSQVPKDTITDSFVLDYRAVQQGTVNQMGDTDTGYMLEFQIPWASLGIHPHDGRQIKIDLCVDDLDTLVDFANIPEGVALPQMSFQSIQGTADYGFPKNWPVATLHGQASAWHRLRNATYWPVIALLLLVFLLPGLLWLGVRNYRLRHTPRKTVPESRLAHFLTQQPAQEAALPHQQLFEQAKEIVVAHLDQDLAPAVLAGHLFISLRQLQRICKEELQITPNTFIISIKMEEAAHRLSLGESSVATLAYALGFADPAYFARVFRKYFGCSPTEFLERKMNGSLNSTLSPRFSDLRRP